MRALPLLSALLCPASPAVADLTLAEDGCAHCVIFAGDRATAHEKLAARDLRDTLRQITGARVEITDIATSGVNILVGRPDRLWVWDYDANFRNYIAPHPNHLATARSIKFCADAGARGMRVQGGHGKLCDLVHMRNWVSCQMMWDASQDPDALRKEFAAGYYGAAGPLVLRYVHLLDTIIHRDNTFLSCFADSTKNWLALEDLNALTRIVTKAEAVTAHDAVLAARVNVLRFSVDAVWLQRYHELKAAAEERGIAFLGPDDPRVALGRFEAIQNNVGHYAERREFPEFVAKLKAIHRETN